MGTDATGAKELVDGVELLDGLPMRLTTTDARRIDIGRRAARIVAGKEPKPEDGVIAYAPTFLPGDTIRAC